MSVLAMSLDSEYDMKEGKEKENNEEDSFDVMQIVTKQKNPKLKRLRSPSFEGYFASRSGAFALQSGNMTLKSNVEKMGEIQAHLEDMIGLLRDLDVLRMAVRIESRLAVKKRYLTVVSSEVDHSAIVGIDWTNEGGPTIGLVLPIWSTTVTELDGDGGLSISRTITRNHRFKPVSVQTLWSAKQVIDKATHYAQTQKYFEGISTNGFLEYYQQQISSDFHSIEEWNEMDDLTSHVVLILKSQKESVNGVNDETKKALSMLLKEMMAKVDLDEVSCKQLRIKCEKELGISLTAYKKFIDEEVLVIMGRMDSASQIVDHLYLGSEWNASDLVQLKALGIGYILNITREVDNFFPQSFTYFNIRVYDEEDVELMKHWDHTYRFIEKARLAGSKVLVHCRHGISRSASTVIAYLMKKRGWSMRETLEYVVERRDIVQPNPAFQNQLIVYDGILNSSRNRFSSLFRQRTSAKPEENTDVTSSKQPEENTVVMSSKHESTKVTSSKQPDEDAEVTSSKQPGNVEQGSEVTSKRKRFKSSKDSYDAFDTVDGIDREAEVVREEQEVEKTVLKEQDDECLVEQIDELIDEKHPSTADTSFSEEVDIEEIRHRRPSISHRGRLMRAKTMLSGAVFIDEEEDTSDVENMSTMGNTSSTDHDSDFTDPDEDKLMEQVVMATQMKNELIRSVQKLQSDSSTETVNRSKEREEFNIKPSLLRKLSHVSALLHFANIAKMKRRKSLTESQLQDIIMEEREDGEEKAVSKINVACIKDMFVHRSKKHVHDYARRRTMNDDEMKDFDIRAVDSDITEFKIDLEHSKSDTDIPLHSQLKHDECINKSIVPIATKVNKNYRNVGNLSRSSSLNTRRHGEKKNGLEYRNDCDRLSVEALDLDTSIHDDLDCPVEDISVADLVNYHSRLIREKSLKQKQLIRSSSNGVSTERCLMSEDVNKPLVYASEESSDSSRSYKNRIKRVQSFPRMKRFSIDELDVSPRDSEESQSLPSSPEFSRRSENLGDITKHTIMAYLEMDATERAEKDVRSIVRKFEQRKKSIDVEEFKSLLLLENKDQTDNEFSSNA